MWYNRCTLQKGVEKREYMELIAQQVELLKNELSSLLQRRQDLIDSKSNIYAACYENQTGDNDRELIDDIATLNVRISKIYALLSNAIVKKYIDGNQIGIGTEFDMLLTNPRGRTKEETRILIAQKVTLEDMSKYLTLETEIGKAVYGRQAGEDFSYKLPNGKTMFGTITALRKTAAHDNGQVKIKS